MWLLVFVFMINTKIAVDIVSEHDTMDLCFESREILVEQLGRPIVNYQVICLKTK